MREVGLVGKDSGTGCGMSKGKHAVEEYGNQGKFLSSSVLSFTEFNTHVSVERLLGREVMIHAPPWNNKSSQILSRCHLGTMLNLTRR